MGFELVPVALIMAIVFTLSPKKMTVLPSDLTLLYEGGQVVSAQYAPTANVVLDRQIIYTFITKTYRAIPTEDADLIATCLVQSAEVHCIEPMLITALIARESSFDRHAVSATGAKGLGQIKDFNFKSLNIQDPFDIAENIAGTTLYLKNMITVCKEKNPTLVFALASYFKGYTAVARDGVDDVSKGYIQDILHLYGKLRKNRKTLEGISLNE